VIWSHGDLLRAGDFGVGRILPINVKLPDKDSVILEDILQLRAASRHHNVRSARRRKPLAINVRVVQEIHSANDDALLAGRLALEHLRALHDACMLLDHVVARAGRDVITVGPDREPRIIGEERSQKFVAIVGSEGIGTGADRVAHRVRALRSGLLSALSSRIGLSARRLAPRLNRLPWRRNEQRNGCAWLTRLTRHAQLRGIAGATGLRLIGTDSPSPEDRHHDQPAIGELVITHDRVAVVRGLARAAEAFEDRVGQDWAVENLASRVEPLALLREDGHPRIDGLHNVVWPDGETVVGRVA
jgi:hypothetical protein